MDQQVHNPAGHDYRQYERVWQRVAPGLEPYPDTRLSEVGVPAMMPVQNLQEAQLPGAQPDPCCMGSAAAEMVDVLTGFIEEELGDHRYYLVMARQAPAWARQRLREIGEEECHHARRLMAVYYLITGECYRPHISQERIYIGHWCAALRERYHEEACGGMNYARAAEGTTDICLSGLLNELSADEYRHAEELMTILERSLQGR